MRTKTKQLFQNKFILKSIQVFLVCLVVFGGTGSAENVRAETGDTWVEVTSHANWTPKPISNQIVDFNNEMWLIGNHGDANPKASWHSTDGISWAEVTSTGESWNGRNSYNILVFNNKLVMIGGRNGLTFFKSVLTSNDGVNWTKLTDDNGYPRSEFASVVFNNKMWIIGGCESYTGGICDFTNSVVSSPDGINWTEVGFVGTLGRRYHSLAVFDNKMWVTGGWLTSSGMTNEVWYSSDGVNWTELTSVGAMWGERSGNSSVVFNNKLWVMGGNDGSGNSYNDIWYLDLASINYGTNTGTWHHVPVISSMWTGRQYHGTLVFDNEMWVIGGYDWPNSTNDVWRTETTWPNPTCTLTASGDPVTLDWTVSASADSAEITNNIDSSVIPAIPDGSETVTPAETTTYTLTVDQKEHVGNMNNHYGHNQNVVYDCIACDGSTITPLEGCQQLYPTSTLVELRDCDSLSYCGDIVCPAHGDQKGYCYYHCYAETTTTCEVTVTVDVCIPTCSTSIGGCLLTDPDPGNTSKTGDECCGVGDCYECSSGVWNGSACATPPPPPLPDFVKGGIVPCGRYTDNPITSWNEMAPCNLCHLIMMIHNLINFLLTIMTILALLALVVTGFLFITSAGDAEKRTQAKSGLKYSIGGFIIILISWIIIDFFLIAFGYLDPLGGKWNVICDEESSSVLTFCGDGTTQSPNDTGIGGPENDGFEDCDLTDDAFCGELGCSANCTCNTPSTFCNDGTVNKPNSAGFMEECDGSGSVCPSGICKSNCTCKPLVATFCGDGTIQSPNDAGEGGPENDGFEECDTDGSSCDSLVCENCTCKEEPTPGVCGVWFSDGLVCPPLAENTLTDFIGNGEYPSNAAAFPKAAGTGRTLHGIAIDANTTLTLWKGLNYTGIKVIDNVTGPVIINNLTSSPLACDGSGLAGCWGFDTTKWTCQESFEIMPPWGYAGSCKITCGTAPAPSTTCDCEGSSYESHVVAGDTVYIDCANDKCWTPNLGTYKWTDAVAKCDNLVYAGHSNWQLPDLSTLFGLCISESSIKTPTSTTCFGENVFKTHYWSSENEGLNSKAQYWYPSNCAHQPYWHIFTELQVRCVKI